MQTLVLDTEAAQEPLERFFQRLGNDEFDIVDSEGKVRVHVIPSLSECDVARQQEIQDKFAMLFLADIDQLKQRAGDYERGVTTAELLRHLNSLPCPEQLPCDSR